jgi:hypothetical protein
MMSCKAGFMLSDDGEVVHESLFVEPANVLRGRDVKDHINILETEAAVQMIEQILNSEMVCDRIIVGIDNTTAVKAVGVGFYPEVDLLSQRLWNCHQRAAEKGIGILAVYLPGELQPANEPSRGAPICVAKVRTAWHLLRKLVQEFPAVPYIGKRQRVVPE